MTVLLECTIRNLFPSIFLIKDNANFACIYRGSGLTGACPNYSPRQLMLTVCQTSEFS